MKAFISLLLFLFLLFWRISMSQDTTESAEVQIDHHRYQVTRMDEGGDGRLKKALATGAVLLSGAALFFFGFPVAMPSNSKRSRK